MSGVRATGARLSLSALLSQVLVAFTIECDNEFEHQMPHRTTRFGSTPGTTGAPWLISMTMWAHCLRHVPEEGIPAAEFARRAQLSPRGADMILKRMSLRSWGYLDIAPERAGAPRSEWLVRLTPAGRQAQQIWAPLADVVTNRWQLRFGAGTPVPRLSELSGIAGMGIENSLSALGRRGHVVVERDPAAGRARLARLTASGLQARAAYLEGVAGVEREWERRCGKHTVHAVREAVQLPLLSGLTPYPDGWRAQVPPLETLPHFPFVSHRGGYPDGS